MTSTGRTVRFLTAAGLAITLLVVAPRPVLRAQNDAWVAPYPLILTPERARAYIDAANRHLDYVPGEVIVKFKDGVSLTGQNRALTAVRSRPEAGQLRWANGVALLHDELESDARILTAQLASQPEVEYVEPNFLSHKTLTPNDPSFSLRQWNFQVIDLPKAWDINPGASSSVTVAVVDSGITTVNQTFSFVTWDPTANRTTTISVPVGTNPDLATSRLVAPRDFAFWNGPVIDMDGHGSHVASTIGEDTNNNLAEAGIAYKAMVMPVKTCVSYWEVQFVFSASGGTGFVPLDSDGCDDFDIAAGIRYAADNGANVINISLGGPGASQTIRSALLYAVGKGAFIAIAMGNDADASNVVSYPAADAKTIDGAMSVGAVGRSLRRAFYSSTGPHLEIVAPGGDSTDGGSAGVVWQATISQNDSDPTLVRVPRFDRYVEAGFQGTSMATPHVSGIAALLYSQGVTNPAAVEALLEKTAKDLGATGRDDEYGFGLVQPRAALFGLGLAR